MRRTIAAAVVAVSASIGAAPVDGARAEPVVVELFTSQGCSSCPPADKNLGAMTGRDDVIALSLHVDYWDYLGWTDKFGSPVHTQRQRAYAAAMRERMIYTPQIVVQGREHVVGSRTADVRDAIARHESDVAAAKIAVSRDGDEISVRIAPTGLVPDARGRVQMAWYTDKEDVAIERGENRGRTIAYHNVVKGWVDLGVWRGDEAEITTRAPAEADGVAILIHGSEGGPIIAAGQAGLR